VNTNHRVWTPYEILIIMAPDCVRLPDAQLATLLGRSLTSIRVKRYAVTHPERASELQKASTKRYKKAHPSRIKAEQKRYYAQGAQFTEPQGTNNNTWTDRETAIITAPWCIRERDVVLSHLLGRTINAIQKRRCVMSK
jgi:hypothetical protein